jgi:hypothetical protein
LEIVPDDNGLIGGKTTGQVVLPTIRGKCCQLTRKKLRLARQSAPIAAEEEDWPRNLASKSGGEEEEAIRKEVFYSFDFADAAFPEMPEM